MAWSLGGITIYVDSDEMDYEANLAIQEILDATTNTITFFGANSERRTIGFTLDETVSAGGKASLATARSTDADVNLTSDQGSQGNYRILSFRPVRIQALNKSSPCYRCVAELIKV